jgi:hypothetical protein
MISERLKNSASEALKSLRNNTETLLKIGNVVSE